MTRICSRCDLAIHWPRRRVFTKFCSLHCYHKQCVDLNYCYACRGMEYGAFLRQTSESGLNEKFRPCFDILKLIDLSNDPLILKFLLKKINVTQTLVESAAENNSVRFDKILANVRIERLPNFNGKTLKQLLQNNQDYSQRIVSRLKELTNRPLPPIPSRAAPLPPTYVHSPDQLTITATFPPSTQHDLQLPPDFRLYPALQPTAPPSYEEATRRR